MPADHELSILLLKPFGRADFNQVCKIYEEGIATGLATFETKVPNWDTWNQAHLESCRIAAWRDEEMLGWAALSPVSGRCVYGGVAEVSLYIAESARGQGIGRHLLQALVDASEQAGLWTLQAGIFPGNLASIRVHEQCGFRKVGYREKIGKHNNEWRDTVLMERRSTRIGV